MTTNLIQTAEKIQNATNLDHLLSLLRDFDGTFGLADDDDDKDGAVIVADLDRLPTWGDTYRLEDPSVYSWDQSRVLRQSEHPGDDGWTIVDRTDIIYPTGGWVWITRRKGFSALVSEYIVDIKNDNNNEWHYKIIGLDNPEIISDSPAWSAQIAAERATDMMVKILNDLPPVQMISILGAHFGHSHRQVEVSMMLGVSQSAVSQWLSGAAEMSRPVRAHIMRILGIERFQGRLDRRGHWIIK